MTRHVTCTTHRTTPTCACKPKNRASGTHAMMSVTRTLLLAAVASVIMASVPVPVTGSAAAGLAGSGIGRVARFVCAHCTSTGELSHRGMFLNQASVRRHIAATKPCCEANMGIREILMEARAGDVMACGGGAAGPAPDVRHQSAGDVQAEIRNNILIPCRTLLMYQHSWSSGLDSLVMCIRFRVRILISCTFCQNVLYAHILAYTGIYRRIPSSICIY
jgi:hypothetical protein